MGEQVSPGGQRISPAGADSAVLPRSATAVVVGAGDYIGAAIAKRFAAEGYTVIAGRRNADKLAPLVAAIAAAGGCCVAQSLDSRKEAEVATLFRPGRGGRTAGGLRL